MRQLRMQTLKSRAAYFASAERLLQPMDQIRAQAVIDGMAALQSEAASTTA